MNSPNNIDGSYIYCDLNPCPCSNKKTHSTESTYCNTQEKVYLYRSVCVSVFSHSP